jgi:hypothetical protein
LGECLNDLVEALEGLREELPVTVDHQHPSAASMGDAGVPRRIYPSIGLVVIDMEPRIALGTQGRRGPVAGSVINHDNLEIVKGLREAAVYAAGDETHPVIRSDDDAKCRLWHR